MWSILILNKKVVGNIIHINKFNAILLILSYFLDTIFESYFRLPVILLSYSIILIESNIREEKGEKTFFFLENKYNNPVKSKNLKVTKTEIEKYL